MVSPAPTGPGVDHGLVVIDWIESNLVHGEGEVYGEPFLLEDWQKAIVRRIYWHTLMEDGSLVRQVRRVLAVMPKGAAKTELIAAVMLAELEGPVTIVNGEPARRKSPNVPIAAASREQAGRLFGAAGLMAEHEKSRLRPYVDVQDKKIQLLQRQGLMTKIAAVAGTNDGGLPTAFGADEIHEWVRPSVRDVHDVIASSLIKRPGGLEVNITTPDDADPQSLLGEMVAHGMKVATGELVDPTFFFIWYGAEEHWNIDDPQELRAAIAEANPGSWQEIERIAYRYEVEHMKEHKFRRYHLGQFRRKAGAWLREGLWQALPTGCVVPGAEIVMGFDGSYSRDSTGLVGCTMDGHVFVIDAWERPEGASEDWIVPRTEVDAAVDAAMQLYKVREFDCDPHRWTTEIEDWETRYGEVVVHFDTGTPTRMAPACDRFHGAVVTGTGISHDNDPRLARHLHNAITKKHRDGDMIVKAQKDSPQKIDLAVAAVIAYDRAITLSGVKPEEGPRIRRLGEKPSLEAEAEKAE